MITRPSIEDLLAGVIRNLETTAAGGGSLDAASFPTPFLLTLDRVQLEWATWHSLLLEENLDLRSTLIDLGAAAPVTPPGVGSPALEAQNRLLKSALSSAIIALGLPAATDNPAHGGPAHTSVASCLERMLHREASVAVAPGRIAPTSGGAARETLPLDELTRVLKVFLTTREPGATRIGIHNLSRLPGGASREAWVFDAEIISGDTVRREPCILMREPVSSVLVSDSSDTVIDGTRRTVGNEMRVLAAMHAAGLPVPQMLWTDTEGEWLERPFSIARRLPGTADTSGLAGTPGLDRLLDEYIDYLVKIHALDPSACGLSFLGQPTRESAAREQVDLMVHNFETQKLEDFPAITWIIEWLRQHAPVASQVSVVHGDYRLGNFLHEDGHIIAILDWEQVHLGDPLEEIAFMYWELWTLGAVISIDDFVARYEARAGRTVDRKALAWYRIFIELKMLVVLLTGSRSFFATEARQLQYGGGQTNQMVREAEWRALQELKRVEPSFRLDAWKTEPINQAT